MAVATRKVVKNVMVKVDEVMALQDFVRQQPEGSSLRQLLNPDLLAWFERSVREDLGCDLLNSYEAALAEIRRLNEILHESAGERTKQLDVLIEQRNAALASKRDYEVENARLREFVQRCRDQAVKAWTHGQQIEPEWLRDLVVEVYQR